MKISEYSDGEELLEWIELDIEKKYNITNPQFLVCRELSENRSKIINWINKWLEFGKYKWIKYRHKHENIFELKECFPTPPSELCHKIIKEEVESTRNWKNDRFQEIVFEINGINYTEKELKKIALTFVRKGLSDIRVRGPKEDLKFQRYISEVSFADDEYGRTIPSGFVVLEQK